MANKDTVDKLLREDNIKELVEDILKGDVKDIALTYRTDDDTIISRWFGDSYALCHMVGKLYENIDSDIEMVDLEENR